jgi:3-carboxy-cis,cis-muconate cycloisomerase
MLGGEAAVAESAADVGLVSAEAAKSVAEAATLERFDLAEVAASAAHIGNPVAGVVDRLKELVPEHHHDAVHYRATSQDILDTAMMLVAREAIAAVDTDLTGCQNALLAMFTEQDSTGELWGRTLLQRAEPVHVLDLQLLWDHAIIEARTALGGLAFPASLSGPVGTTWSKRPRPDQDVRHHLSTRLGLDDHRDWHTVRAPVVRIGAAAAEAAGACGKVAVDILLLSQNEIGEVSEARGGGSTSMPHKRNSVAATAARACAARTPGLVATLYAAMPQELQRSPGLWHSEWETLSDLLRLTGSAAAWLRESLAGLRLHPDAMERNLGRSGE